MLTPRWSRLPVRLRMRRKSVDEPNTSLDDTLRDDLTVITTFVAHQSCGHMETCGQHMTINHSGKMIRLFRR
jgi:hypothetical protein